jgi:hypothetical protein
VVGTLSQLQIAELCRYPTNFRGCHRTELDAVQPIAVV